MIHLFSYLCTNEMQMHFKNLNTINMEPIKFEESNITLTAPGAMPDCGDLPAYTDGKQCVSCWKPTFKERIKILFTGRVWLGVMGSRTQPPVWMTGEKPFVSLTLKERFSNLFKGDHAETWAFVYTFAISCVVCAVLGILYNDGDRAESLVYCFIAGAFAAIPVGLMSIDVVTEIDDEPCYAVNLIKQIIAGSIVGSLIVTIARILIFV